MSIDHGVRMNPRYVADKFARVEKRFGGDAELFAVLTKGESLKERTAEAVQKGLSFSTDPLTFHTTMEEGSWAWNLVTYLKNEKLPVDQRMQRLTSFLGLTKALAGKHGHHSWAPISARLIDRLETLAKSEGLPRDAQEQIQKTYLLFKDSKDGREGIDARRAKRAKEQNELDTIFSGDQNKDVRERIVRPETGVFSHKHAGCFLLETPDFGKRIELLGKYFTAINSHPHLDLSKKLVRYMEKHIKKYSTVYQGEMPAELKSICERAITAFRYTQTS